MYTLWTQHIKDQDAKAKFQETIKSAKPVLDHLNRLLSDYERGIDRSEIDISTFDKPNWAERQAFKNGQRSMITFLKTITDLDQQEI